MNLEYLQKNLTDVENGIILHGCNCQGVMGAGVAKALRNKWPQIFLPYKTVCNLYKENQHELLGQVCFVEITNDLIVGNIFSQIYYGNDGKKYADINAIIQGIKKASVLAEELNLAIYMPKIGCGLGGLLWEDVLQEINKNISKYNIQIFICEL